MSAHTTAGKALRYTVMAVGVIALVSYGSNLTSRYQTLRRSLDGLGGVRFIDSREEVFYRLGPPTYVLAPPDPTSKFQGSQRIYYTSVPQNDKNAIPAGSKIQDFAEWAYEKAHGNARLYVRFSPSGQVEKVGWYSPSQDPTDWGPVIGIHNGDPEEVVLDLLGKPGSSTVKDVSKTLHYRDLGLTIILTKGRAYSMALAPREKGEWPIIRHFLRTLP